MAVRFVLGRAGSGKTHYCLASIRAELAESPLGPALILLVPEQAAAQMERALLSGGNLGGTFRAQVLSFRRLGYKLLGASGQTKGIIPSVAERMILRHVLNTRREELQVYGEVVARAGLVGKLLGNLKELIAEGTEASELRQAAEGTNNPQLAGKLHDLAIVLQAYKDYVGRHGLERTEALDGLAERIEQTEWLESAQVWVDGFAGFTGQEIEALVALGQRCRSMDICLLMDADYSGRLRAEPLRLFNQTEQTYHKLREVFSTAGVDIDNTMRLEQAGRGSHPELVQLEAGIFASPGVAADSPARIKLLEMADRRSEVDAVVGEILRLSREGSLRYRDMAIIVRELSVYHDLLAAALEEHEIPFFIDRRYNLSHHAAVELLRSVLAVAAEGFSHQAVRGLLKTGLLGIDQERLDRLENYILAHGIKGAGSWRGGDWAYTGHMVLPGDVEDVGEEVGEDLARVNATRRELLEGLGDWLEAADPPDKRIEAKQWAGLIVRLLERLNVKEQLSVWAGEAQAEGRAELAQQHRRVWVCLVELLEQMVTVLGDEEIDLAELAEILQASMADFTLGLVPLNLDQVLVGSVQRSRHPALRAAFVIGMNEGVFPRVAGEDAVLSDRERTLLAERGLSLGPTAEELFFQERLLGYIALTRPTECLWVSYPAADEGGRALNASVFVGQLLRAVPGLKVEKRAASNWLDAPEQATTKRRLAGALAGRFRAGLDEVSETERAKWLAAYNWLGRCGEESAVKGILSSLTYDNKAELDKKLITSLLGKTVRTSKTGLESFASCPFQHYARQVLKLHEREDASVADVDLGRMYHRAMERLGRELIRRKSRLAEMNRDEAVELIREISGELVEQLARTEPALQTGRNRFLAGYMREHLARAVAGGHLRSGLGELYPAVVEQGFGIGKGRGQSSWPALCMGLGRGQGMELHGVIDLLELAEVEESAGTKRYAVVYDYKRSRERPFKLSAAYYGLDLQLLIYLMAVRELGPDGLAVGRIEPVGGFYISLKGTGVTAAKTGECDEADEEETLTRSRPRGVFRADKLSLLDKTPTGRLRAVHATITKDGQLSRRGGDGLSVEDFETVLTYGRKVVRQLGHLILAGVIGVHPYRWTGRVPCNYCKFGRVCRVDPLMTKHNELEINDDRMALEMMRQEK